MRIGSCFSGLGAMDLAAERHFGGRTVWFCEQDKHCKQVLARHWPGVPVYDDVRTLVADGAEPIDCLLGGPPCQDVSAAGRQAGLVDGERSSLFFDFVAVADALKPRLVIVENVPALLSKWRGVVEDAFAAAGYGCTWARVAAQHVGAPHKRLRVFILAERGGPHRGVCDAGALPAVGALVRQWGSPQSFDANPCCKGEAATQYDRGRRKHGGNGGPSVNLREQVARSDERLLNGAVQPQAWPTPNGIGAGGAMSRGHDRIGERLLGGAVMPAAWPTPRAAEPGNGRRNRTNEQYAKKSGATLRESVQPQAWPTPAAQEPGIDAARLVDRDGNRPDTPMQRCFDKDTGRLAQTGLAQAVQGWPTPAAMNPNDGQDPATYRARLARLKAQHNNGNGAGVVLAQAVQAQPTPADADDDEAQQAVAQATTARLNPDFVEVLQGLPPGWSEAGGESLLWAAQITCGDPPWPAPMVRGMWGDSPQHAWEPPRTVSVRVAARSARLRALGNANPPQQYLLAFELLERGPAQVSLFELMA